MFYWFFFINMVHIFSCLLLTRFLLHTDDSFSHTEVVTLVSWSNKNSLNPWWIYTTEIFLKSLSKPSFTNKAKLLNIVEKTAATPSLLVRKAIFRDKGPIKTVWEEISPTTFDQIKIKPHLCSGMSKVLPVLLTGSSRQLLAAVTVKKGGLSRVSAKAICGERKK